jgi:hypothetical protein
MTRRIAVARIGAVFMVTLIEAASASAYGLVPAITQTEAKPVEPKPCNGVLLTASRPEPSAAANLYYLVL